MSYAQGAKVRVNAQCEGIGPMFKIKLEVQNMGKKTVMNSRISLSYNEQIFKQINPNPSMPVLLPGLTYNYEMLVKNISPTGASGLIKAIVS